MAEQESNSLASTYPNPPSFWKEFTPDRIARIDELRTAHLEEHGGDALTVRVPGVPEELVGLQPPAEPADGKWRIFGDQYMVILGSMFFESKDGGADTLSLAGR